MDELLTTKQAASLFAKSEKTIGRYVDSFSKHFSDPAKQLDGSQRRLNADDLRVLSLIHLMKAQGKTYALIGEALEKGERAEPPIHSQLTTPKSYGRELALETRIHTLETELERLRTFETKAALLAEQNAALLTEIRKLEREIGALLAKRD